MLLRTRPRERKAYPGTRLGGRRATAIKSWKPRHLATLDVTLALTQPPDSERSINFQA
jgi:hypothetical protein